MKISKHSDGSYSITGMTRGDVSDLALGMCSSAARRAEWSGMDAQDIEWAERNRAAADRLYSVLHAITESCRSGSIVVSSSDGYSDEDAFKVVKVNTLMGWDKQDITSHLKRKEG